MGNILIVDDDHLIRDGLLLMIKGIAPEESLITAGNGFEAFQTLMQMPVDLIFTDIKMPVMDGLELMEKLREMQYAGEVVVISGFDEFDFARRAMKSGAADYLLKPIKAEEMKSVYEECKRRIKLKGGLIRKLPGNSTQSIYLQQSQVTRLLTKEMPEQNPASVFPDYLSHVLAVVTDSFSLGRTGPFETQQAFLTGQELSDTLPENPFRLLIQGEYRQNWVMLFLLPQSCFQTEAVEITKAVAQKGLHYGMSKFPVPIADCLTAYHEAHSALEQHFFDVVPNKEIKQEEMFPYANHIQLLTEAIAACDKQKASQMVEALFQQAAIERPNVDVLRQQLISTIYAFMNENKDFIGVIGKYKFTDHDIILKIRDAVSFSQLMQEFNNNLLLYLDELQDRRLSKDDYIIQRAKAYIDSCFETSVSLVEIAEKLGLHPNYLSTLFHQKTGQTFSDYLRCVRIQKAIQLMNDTNLKVYEIAQQVGYSDTAQFYRSFKQATGISPGKYKQKHTQ